MQKLLAILLAAGATLLVVIGAFLLILAVSGLGAAIVTVVPFLVWNYVLAPLFHGPQLTFIQTFGLCWAIGFVANTIRRIVAPSKSE